MVKKTNNWKIESIILLLLFTINTKIIPLNAESENETKWILDQINVGEGGQYITPEDTRGKGSFEKWSVSQTSIQYHSRFIDNYGTEDFNDAHFEFTLPEFPSELASGQQIELTTSGIGTGYMRSGYFSVIYEFWSSNIALIGKNSNGEIVKAQMGPFMNLDIDSQTDIPNSDTLTISFETPSGDLDDEFTIGIFAWNGISANVEWIYRCVSEEFETPEYGIIEREGNLYLVSPPGGILEISMGDLPAWARAQMVTVGALCVCVGPPDTVKSGDTSILLEGQPVARVHDSTAHGGIIVDGSDRIFVNGVPAAFRGGMHICPMITPPIPHVGGPIVYNCEWEFSEEAEFGVGYDQCVKKYLDELNTFIERSETNPSLIPPVFEIKKAVSRGSTVLDVDAEGVEIGDAVVIGSDPDLSEVAIIVDKGSIVLDRPLKNSYPAGTLVTRVPDNYTALVLPPTEEELSITLVDDESGSENEEQRIPGFPLASIVVGFLMISFILTKISWDARASPRNHFYPIDVV